MSAGPRSFVTLASELYILGAKWCFLEVGLAMLPPRSDKPFPYIPYCLKPSKIGRKERPTASTPRPRPQGAGWVGGGPGAEKMWPRLSGATKEG